MFRRIAIALRALLAALADGAAAERIDSALARPALPKSGADASSQPRVEAAQKTAASRSEAVTLLSALQRDARFVDLVKQPLKDFSDEQVGGAARQVLGDCRAVLDRFFAIEPVTAGEEGTSLQVPAGYDPAEYKLTGRVQGSGPFQGAIVHHGWRATCLQLPAWTGSAKSALVISPAEIELPSTSTQLAE